MIQGPTGALSLTHPRPEWAQRHLGGRRTWGWTPGRAGIPPILQGGPLPTPQPRSRGVGSQLSRGALSLVHFSNKSERLEYGSLGTRMGPQLFIHFASSFPVNISPFHELINLLFPETEKRAFGPGWALRMSRRLEITSCPPGCWQVEGRGHILE